jgi:TonB family protein
MVAAPYPPTVYLYRGQVVVVEVELGTKGEVKSQKVIQGAEGLNAAALEAATKWRFRPARRNGKAVEAFAYIVFGFREPVGSGLGVVTGRPENRSRPGAGRR